MNYSIHVNPESGEIVKLERNLFNPTKGLIGYKVPEEYLELIDEIYLGTQKRRNFRVDVKSPTLKILRIEDIIFDPSKGKFISLSFVDHNYDFNDGFMLEIFTDKNRPHIKLSYKGHPSLIQNRSDKKIKFYATHIEDLTIFYEKFVFDTDMLLTDEKQILPIQLIDTEKLISWDFSIFTRKLAPINVCKFEWPHPSYMRIRE